MNVDAETIQMRLGAVSELTENEEMFYNLQTVVGRALDVDHLLAQCVQIPKQETVKTAESKITTVIYLKHTLELVNPLKAALVDSQNTLLKAYHKVSKCTCRISCIWGYQCWYFMSVEDQDLDYTGTWQMSVLYYFSHWMIPGLNFYSRRYAV